MRLPGVADSYPAHRTQSSLLDRRVAVRSALKAGALGGIVGMVVPLLGLMLAGSVAVYLFRREKGVVPGARTGGRVGGAAGIVLFAIDYVRLIVEIFVLHGQQEYVEGAQKVWQALGFNPNDPAIQASIHNAFTVTGLTVAFVFGLIFTVVMAGLVGAVAAWFMRSQAR